MPVEKLAQALQSVDWSSNVAEFLTHAPLCERMVQCNTRLAIWSKQLEIVDKGNAALPFIREMQSSGHHVAVLASLALYKPAAAATRTVFETALYYTYFRTHPCELTTLVRDENFFVQKSELIDYHRKHTRDFAAHQGCFNLVGSMNKWYNRVSSIVHGQIPGIWSTHRSVSEIAPDGKSMEEVVETFREGEEIVHHLLLCTVGVEMWDAFSSAAKKELLAGIPGSKRAALGLDSA